MQIFRVPNKGSLTLTQVTTYIERLRLCLEKVLYLGKPQDRTFRKSWLMLQSLPTQTNFSVRVGGLCTLSSGF
jgi:hypothetical protein